TLVEGHSSDQIRSTLHCLPHKGFTARIAQNAFLRERNYLNVNEVFVPAARRGYAFKWAQATNGIDTNVRPHVSDTIGNSGFNDSTRSLGNILNRIAALPLPNDFDRLCQRSGFVWANGLGNENFIQVNVRIDKPWYCQPPLGVDGLFSLGVAIHSRKTPV